ncbi:hypothetical protein [Halomonas sp.]|jgi:hypothetical protein|uniref:hypothetical protein n=1 Tax=Halomonas sp. TaxID=1486246 RepID=UPI0035672244
MPQAPEIFKRSLDYIRDLLHLFGHRLVIDCQAGASPIYSIQGEDQDDGAWAREAIRRLHPFMVWRAVAPPSPEISPEDAGVEHLSLVEPDPEPQADEYTLERIQMTYSRLVEHVHLTGDPACVEAATRLGGIVRRFERRMTREAKQTT